MASAQNEQNDQHRKACDDARHDLQRIEPQLIQTGIDDADRDKARHRPVLDRRALVDQIIAGVAQLYLQVSAAVLHKGVGQLRDLFLGNGVVIPQRLSVPGDAGQGIAAIILLYLHGNAADYRQRAAVEGHKAVLAAFHIGASDFFAAAPIDYGLFCSPDAFRQEN